MIKWILTTFLLLASAAAQVSVSLAPVAHMQFLSTTGVPLANGKVFTYDAGTTNLRNTYKDSTGTPQNTDPIVLDSGGFADIWLANQAYKFVVQNSLGVQQWTVDNITGYLGLLNLTNTWTFPQTFTQPITDTTTDNQFVLGAFGNQTTLDFPPPTGNVTLHFPNTSDTMVGRATTDTLSNKTFSNPSFNGATITGPGPFVKTSKQIGADFTTTSLVPVTVFTLDNLNANQSYSFDCKMMYKGSATTISATWTLSGPAAPTNVHFDLEGSGFNTSVNVSQIADATAYGATLSSGTLQSANTTFVAHLLGSVENGANTGNLLVQAFVASGTLTISRGSFCSLYY